MELGYARLRSLKNIAIISKQWINMESLIYQIIWRRCFKRKLLLSIIYQLRLFNIAKQVVILLYRVNVRSIYFLRIKSAAYKMVFGRAGKRWRQFCRAPSQWWNLANSGSYFTGFMACLYVAEWGACTFDARCRVSGVLINRCGIISSRDWPKRRIERRGSPYLFHSFFKYYA